MWRGVAGGRGRCAKVYGGVWRRLTPFYCTVKVALYFDAQSYKTKKNRF